MTADPPRGLPRRLRRINSSELYEGIEYKEFWEGRSRIRVDEVEHALIRNLLPPAGQRIIDIGCGFGRLADCYLDRFEKVVMVDGSLTLLKQARERTNGRAVFIAADAYHLPIRESTFDCALMIRVFHHLADSQSILSEIQRVLNDSGLLVFNYCNKQSIRQLFRWLLRKGGTNPFTLEPAGSGTFFASHHPEHIHGIMTGLGYSNVKYFGTGGIEKAMDNFNWKWLPSSDVKIPHLSTYRLAPWIMCRANVHGKNTKTMGNPDDWMVCPECGNDLQKSFCSYVCLACNREYPVEDGIADFRILGNGRHDG